MIPVTPAAEPAGFASKVRNPGVKFLRATPNPTNAEWRGKDYWRKALSDLWTAYNGICAYSASWTPRATPGGTAPEDSTVDHYVPKSAAPNLAYEWANYRLCRRRLNTRKDNFRDVLDPFTVGPGWIELDFRTFLLVPNGQLAAQARSDVVATIQRLELNKDNDYVLERIRVIREYCLARATFAEVAKRYPFMAFEMERQDFDNQYLPRMKPYFLAEAP